MSYRGDFINGKFLKVVKGDGLIKDISPSDLEDKIMEVPFSHSHVDLAIESAKKAYLPWARLSIDQRKNYLLKLKTAIEAHKAELTEALCRDTGKPQWESATEISALIGKIDITLGFSSKLIAEEKIVDALPSVDGYIRHKPRGVMAVLGPFNFPVHLPNGHIIPALFAGNTVVFKPSDQTPLVTQVYASCFEKAEFPPGVFNMLHGDAETGRKIVVHDHIDGILFTGSFEVGQKIKQETINHYNKILALEMGGKNSTVIWKDADLEKALYETLIGAYLSTGQRCACTSRVLIHEDIADQFIEKFYQAAKKITIGHWKENVFMGPLINAASVEKYIRFQEIANRENCESLMRGKALELKHKGHYVTPSIHLVNKYDPQSVYQKTEIFGPNVAFLKVNDFDQTLDIVNSTGFGLVMALFSKDRALYEKALLEARVGLLNFNRTTNGASSKLPFGGMGKSGNDRPSAHFALQYCSVPVASLEDNLPLDKSKLMPGIFL